MTRTLKLEWNISKSVLNSFTCRKSSAVGPVTHWPLSCAKKPLGSIWNRKKLHLSFRLIGEKARQVLCARFIRLAGLPKNFSPCTLFLLAMVLNNLILIFGLKYWILSPLHPDSVIILIQNLKYLRNAKKAPAEAQYFFCLDEQKHQNC